MQNLNKPTRASDFTVAQLQALHTTSTTTWPVTLESAAYKSFILNIKPNLVDRVPQWIYTSNVKRDDSFYRVDSLKGAQACCRFKHRSHFNAKAIFGPTQDFDIGGAKAERHELECDMLESTTPSRMFNNLTLLIFALLSTVSPTLAQTDPVSSEPDFSVNATLGEEQTLCVDPHPFYPDWAGSRLIHDDCLSAYKDLWLIITPQYQQQRRWTYWFQAPAPKTPYQQLTPLGMVHGT
ncbi:uncharacterized protein KY384_005682 [Bacidia gigantensis]|uniref:uncharacterized protein n=1 Tax=Bacidia gigantensis TaxID=2732470 RepID=UPI001D03D62E|nr:uncharacterized protein KY384_005682 [Bacidia gigantensis]KAG8529048.1 hypothetical protein KY384_005682 [Bacidia gigantensis]